MRRITYKKSGVDIFTASAFKAKLKPLVRKSFREEVLKDIGGFGSFFKLDKNKYKEPVLVSSSDGVGTKLKIAQLANKHDTVGIDAVAMNVNDILCTGAEPLFFLDYIAFSKAKETVLIDVVKGINAGCRQSGCSLIGGETAQMPGMYRSGEYDIAGFCVGIVERKNIIDGSQIRPGDLVIGLESSGIHSNGYSLVRKVFSQNEIKRMSKELLISTRIYVKPVLALLANSRTRGLANDITGIAHITGGAFYDKIARILPRNVNARLDKSSWVVPKIFRLIQNKGNIKDKEMYHTFNMGIGMVLIVEPNSAKAIIAKLAELKLKSWIIGEVIKGKREVQII
ncbi:MAG: phosphoribosylformylglycinamidine cyclo-ligase [Candidatus Omnitrophica bacterium CG08_land_8_20_14_0_20_41_16]|uniref:Phosphoribosylformylglycinamidine cyclo-ligase n=1 Tax=Candidatus Sherwoodlollariibacterium unditelluris TaxID=1974757 RepID=A0A2G9YN63_9BACT|nr:MAG: phosphoribosylformylglycinamidine cyclo-ligase [Candidatus Omnitrophica bacterium CG23_combo_of_CG06-09_8_20_14_all_41_10]PIS33957.1 MAG: phosphoribosylformylglycinamidine cyclo-ligase [Candidatus Omnitrophica bacterium CG08_land_8_20_14_0_20_41_16]